MFSKEITENVNKGSEIRAMFEQGAKLRAIYGVENVFDYSLGNPDPEAEEKVTNSIIEYAKTPGIHKYMANAGYTDVREKIAAYTAKESGVELKGENVLMVAGAAAGLNVVFKAILNPGEEVIAISPYFVEYSAYVKNYRGVFKTVKAKDETFDLDVEAIAASITENTKAIILNSPNNPTGVVYGRETLKKLAVALKEAEEKIGHPIFVISDEPYVKIVYDGVEVPPMLAIFPHSLVVNSFSKSLALPGERIGYIVANPAIPEVDLLMQCMILCARTLGYVNAPSLFQKVIADNLELATGLESYKERRDVLHDIITRAGFSCRIPEGAFYLFVKSPLADDRAFCAAALKHNLILVSGSGFGCPGYFRLAYCVSMDSIKNSEKAWMALGKEFGLI